MEKFYLILLSFCFAVLLNAQIPKTSAITTSGLTSKTDTFKRTVPNLTNKGKSDKALPKNTEILMDLENAIHGNQQMKADFLNRNETSPKLMSLTGTDKISAGKLLMELENNLISGAFANPKSPSQQQLKSNIGNNAQTTALLEKVQNMSRLMAMNNMDVDKNTNTPSEVLREVLHLQISCKSKSGIPNLGATNLPVQKQVEPNNLMQQLDSKIKEDEQRAELFARHRMKMEWRMVQGNQNQNQNK